MIILFDQDGVLANFELAFYDAFCERYPKLFAIEPHLRTTFKIRDQYPAEYYEFIEAIQNRRGFFATLPPIPGAVEAIHQTVREGHHAYICTTPLKRAPYCTFEKAAWIKKHLGELWLDNFIPTADKTLVRGSFLIDDRPTIKGLLVPSWSHIMYDAPYNAGIPGKRLADWSHWPELLAELTL